MMHKILCTACILGVMAGCTQEFSGSTYRVQGGRSIGELFTQGTTAYSVTAEFRFDKKR